MIFKFDEENTNKVYSFSIENIDDSNEEDVWEKLYEEIVDGTKENPGTEGTYGVHDADYGQDELGFTSYEVTDEKMPELMEIFQQWFWKNGFNPGPVQVAVREDM